MRLEAFDHDSLIQFINALKLYKENACVIQEPELVMHSQEETAVKDALRSSEGLDWNDQSSRESWMCKKLRSKESEYSHYKKLISFIGTFNVNGLPPPSSSLDPWLIQNHPIDIYVLGFQEIDSSPEAYLVYDPSKEMRWSKKIEQSLVKMGSFIKVNCF